MFSSHDKSLAALLGASPGASVAVNIALETIKTCLPHLLATAEGRARMKKMIPVYDEDLKLPENAAVYEKTSRAAEEALGLGLPATVANGASPVEAAPLPALLLPPPPTVVKSSVASLP